MYGYCMFINCTYRTKKSRWWKLLVSEYKLRNSTKSWHKSLICTTAGCSSVPLVLKTETKKRHKQQDSCEGPSRVLQVNLTEATVKTECDWMCERNDPSAPYVTHLHLQWTCCPDSSQCFSATGRIHHSALVCPDARWESNTLSCVHDKSVSAHCTQPALSLSLVNTETSVSSFNHLQQSCLLLLPRHREEEPVVGLVIVVVLKLHLVACRVSHAAQLLQHEASLHLRLGLLPVHQAVLPWRLFVHTGW